ncbi:MAG: alpha/beta hydrolase [Candidatus Melainabacteria bacterium]|nr:alpha/beta hydrolase [Candidatus Melainabacteria bacterium]
MKKFAILSLIALFMSLSTTLMVRAEQLAGAKAAIICIPGLTQSSKTYDRLTQSMAPHGIMVKAIDVKGFANAIGEDGKQEQINFNATMDLVKDTADQLKKDNNDIPVFVLGESTGGTFAMLIADKYPGYIDGIICSAPTWKVTGMKKVAVYQILDMTVLRSRKRGLAVGSVFNRVTDDKKLRKELAQLESRRQRFTVVEAMKFLMFTKRLPLIANSIDKMPVLFVQGMKDKLSQPTETALLFKNIATSRKTFIVDSDAEHLIYEEGQFSENLLLSLRDWVLNAAGGATPLTPKGVLFAKDNMAKKKAGQVDKVFSAAGVIPGDSIARQQVDNVDNVSVAKFAP